MREGGLARELALSLRFALREMRGGLRGFYIFLGCIALGVAAISGVNSVARAITQGIAVEGQAILGGDVSVSLVQREANSEQLAFFKSQGTITVMTTMRAMARLGDGSDQTLVELKAIDGAYPLYGNFDISGSSLSGPGPKQVWVEPLLLERLQIEAGATIEVGSANFTVASTIVHEPDKLGDGIGFGPRLIMSREGLGRTGLVQPGSLLRNHYKIRLQDSSASGVSRFAENLEERFPSEAWRVRSRENAAPALSRSVERFSQFLTLVGLTSLIVGGVGVANATRAYLETKRPVIATLKSLGAPGRLIFNLYLIQIMIITLAGIAAGLLLGIAMPYAARSALSGLLPIPDGNLVFPEALLPGILFGILTALIFAIWPLAVSRDIQATDLFRASAYQSGGRLPRFAYLAVLALCIALLVGSAIFLSENRFVATVFISAIAVAFVILMTVGLAVKDIAKRVPSPGKPATRMAIANIHRPGSLTSSVILSLGLGLSLLVALATIDGNLRLQVSSNLSNEAPDFFFVDIQNTEMDGFRETLLEASPDGKIIAVPMLRGRVVSLKGIPAGEYETPNGGEWVLRGDRGITYAKNMPENSTLSQGQWWEPGYQGPPLVSVSAEEAVELDLSIGDEITVNVLGREITATIASFREVQWETLGINFVFVFSPNTFAGAPHSWLATLTADRTGSGFDDALLLRTLAADYPAVTAVRIRDALDTVNTLIGQLSTAIRAAALVALLTSVLVLAGALASGNRERVHDAVVLKTLGGTRKTLITMMVTEYSLLGLATAVFALLAGSLAAWFVISVIMDFRFTMLPGVAAATLIAALAFTIILGLLGTWRILGQKAAPVLREL